MRYLDELKIIEPVIVSNVDHGNTIQIKDTYIEYNGNLIVSQSQAHRYFSMPNVYVYETKQSIKRAKGERLFKGKPYQYTNQVDIIGEFLKRKKAKYELKNISFKEFKYA